MGYSKDNDFDRNRNVERSDLETPTPDDVADIDDSQNGPCEPSDDGSESRINTNREIGLAERLRDAFCSGGNGDLLTCQDRRGNGVMRWLQALDLQVVGACRADERLKPLLKLNVSGGVAEDRLLAQLSQHFEASEVGMLARCLCVPLVSIRVGKVIKQGNLLCPTTERGHLNLNLLPSSDLQLSFTGDDGRSERLAILAVSSESSAVVIEEIAADASGRSFLVKLQGDNVLYFWCSEKSKLVGVELLSKMKDLLSRKPSLAELTGISETRLSCFAVHLRSYLLGPAGAKQSDSTVSSSASPVASSGLSEVDPNTQLSNSLKSSRGRLISSHVARSHLSLHQSSLSPRSNNFKEGFLRNTFLTKSGAREKLRRRGDHCGGSSSVDNMTVASISDKFETQLSSLQQTESDKCPEDDRCCNYPPSSPETLNESLPLSLGLPPWSLSQVPSLRSSFSSPYSCWCPPCTPAFQYSIAPNLPSKVTEPVSLPPLSTLLSAGRSSSSWDPPTPSLDAADISSLEIPSFVPDPLVRLPLPVSPLISIPSSQQILTFTPLMSDPIVHIPVIDVCSSGQGYLVSAGPAISTSISPPLPNLVGSRIPDSESVVEKNARETLRLLIGSTKSSPALMDMLPAVPTNTDENISCIHEKKFCAMVSGSRGLYSRGGNVDAITSSISAMGLDLLIGRSIGEDSSANASTVGEEASVNALREHDSGNDLVNSGDEDDPSIT